MKYFVISFLVCLKAQTLVFGQAEYSIHYNKPTTLKVNGEWTLGNENFYDVSFLNATGQVIKTIEKNRVEDHHSKTGYFTEKHITYFFYSDSLKMSEISIDLGKKTFSKTTYVYDENKNMVQWRSYSSILKLAADSFKSAVSYDLFLNRPELFPAEDLRMAARIIRKFQDNKIIYKCYYEKLSKYDTVPPAREEFFKYNSKGQLVEHISNPKSGAGGTAFLRQTFEYGLEGKLMRQDLYENEKHQGIKEYNYTDSTIIVQSRHFDEKGNLEKYIGRERKFVKQDDGFFYDSYNTRFSICGDADWF